MLAGLAHRVAQLSCTLAQPEPGLAWVVADASALAVDQGWTEQLVEVKSKHSIETHCVCTLHGQHTSACICAMHSGTFIYLEPGLAWVVADASTLAVDQGWTDQLVEVRCHHGSNVIVYPHCMASAQVLAQLLYAVAH